MKTLVFKLNQFPLLSETFILAQIITAIDCGFKVKILVSELLDIEGSKQEGLIQKYGIHNKIVVEDFEIPNSRILRLLKSLYLLTINIKYLRKIIAFYKEQDKYNLSWIYQFHFFRQFKNFDIAHVQFGTNVRPFDILKKSGFLKSKLIVSFHGHDAFFPISGYVTNNGYYDTLFNYGDFIIANTPYLGNEILALGCPSQKLKIIPVGVDTAFFSPIDDREKESKTFSIITVGRLSKVKGHEYAIEVVESLNKKGYQVHLTIVGEGKERKTLDGLIAEKGLKNVVELVGRKGQLEVRELLRSNDVFLFTSVATLQERRESQGLATLEAQACGLPVIVFDSGGVKYTVKDEESGFVVPEYDTEMMTSRILQLIKNVDQLEKMSSQAVKFVNENYSQKVIDKKWKYLYGSLSNGK